MRIRVNKTNKGITLIALVITIIVLLILAGVTIATLMGDNGILTKANEAREQTEESQEEELRRLTALEAVTNTEGTTHTDNSTGKEKTVTVPAGFAVSQVEGENTIDDGLVVIDKSGNEFVWIPVDDYSEYERRKSYYNGNIDSDDSFLKFGESNENGINDKLEETTTTKVEAQEMFTSVRKNKGFYIARYESGKDRNGNVVVKKGTEVYNYIQWSANGEIQETNEITGGAVELARNFDTMNDYTNVTSTLIYGVQWDAVMKWMENIENPNTAGTLKNYIQDSTGMGWYSNNSGNTVHKTGIDIDNNKSNCVKNIYDLAGNVAEWTMESYNTDGRVRRGGNSYDTGFRTPASNRHGIDPSNQRNRLWFPHYTIFV